MNAMNTSPKPLFRPYTQIVSKILFPLHERLKHHDSVRRFKQLEKSQWLTAEALQAEQSRKLGSLMQTVGQSVPYYRQLFKSLGVADDKINSLEALQQLPLLDKANIRQNFKQMIHEQAHSLQRYNTGGSTGEPLIFMLGKARKSHDVAAKWRATRWWGVEIGDPELVVWGSPVELGKQDKLRWLRDKLFRSQLFSAFEMNDQTLHAFQKVLTTWQPAMLFGYPFALSQLAEFCQQQQVSLQKPPQVAFVTSERLYPAQAELIESAFQCPVANGYGGRDFGFVAHACPQGSLHISAEDIIVEIVAADGTPLPKGESGEIVITHLASGDFPFIRYRTGDIGSLSKKTCSCGRGLPILAKLDGRQTDFITAADGTRLHGLALIYILRDIIGIQQFKIIQHDLHHTEILLITDPQFDKAVEQNIIKSCRQRLGQSVNITINYVSEIAREQSGKFRYVVSKLSH